MVAIGILLESGGYQQENQDPPEYAPRMHVQVQAAKYLLEQMCLRTTLAVVSLLFRHRPSFLTSLRSHPGNRVPAWLGCGCDAKVDVLQCCLSLCQRGVSRIERDYIRRR